MQKTLMGYLALHFRTTASALFGSKILLPLVAGVIVRHRTSGRRQQSGQTLIEFAFMTPVLALLIITIAMIALSLHTRSNLQQAVREGARQAAVGRSLSEVQDLAAGNAGGTLDANEIGWCLPAGSSGSVGDEIRVFIDEGANGSEGYGFVLVPLGDGIFSAMGMSPVTVNMAPRATARLEKSVSGIPACSS